MSGNPFVDYLKRYTTISPEHEAAFDEFITQTEPPSGSYLRLDTKIEKFLLSDLFSKKHPPSVILTGNAGDGKTYLCRQVATYLNGSLPRDWEEKSSWAKQLADFNIIILKDLSEVGEAAGDEFLHRLAYSYQETAHEVFLIAANEGRLRAILSKGEDLHDLRADVEAQLRDGPNFASQHLIVINLNQISTSSFVKKALEWFTATGNWKACEECPANSTCPIHYNAKKLSEDLITNRFQHLYKVLEYLDIHVTIRDMLIHLAYSITGGMSCYQVVQKYLENKSAWIEEVPRYVYYQNVWGASADDSFRYKALAIRNLSKLNVGDSSVFAVDDFIITGSSTVSSPSEVHKEIFSESLDLGFKRFEQERTSYLQGGATSPKPDQVSSFLKWLPHCRRKLFFEWDQNEIVNRLSPFSFIELYFKLLDGDQSSLYSAKRDLVLGLNRSFSGLFLTNREVIYVTSQYAHAVEQPVPIVLVNIPLENLELSPISKQSAVLDQELNELNLKIYPPAKVKASPVEWRINLLRFEYLMRRSQGGTANILSAECELSIRQLKDDLISHFYQEDGTTNRIDFFAADRNRYQLQRMWVDENEHIRLGGGAA